MEEAHTWISRRNLYERRAQRWTPRVVWARTEPLGAWRACASLASLPEGLTRSLGAWGWTLSRGLWRMLATGEQPRSPPAASGSPGPLGAAGHAVSAHPRLPCQTCTSATPPGDARALNFPEALLHPTRGPPLSVLNPQPQLPLIVLSAAKYTLGFHIRTLGPGAVMSQCGTYWLKQSVCSGE